MFNKPSCDSYIEIVKVIIEEELKEDGWDSRFPTIELLNEVTEYLMDTKVLV